MVGYLTHEASESVLMNLVSGHLGCNDGFNTYVYPVNYIYNGKYITCQSFMGAKIEVMRRNNRVCLQVDDIKSSTNWKSVMVLGEYQEIDNERDRYEAMKAFIGRLMYPKTSETMMFPEKAKDTGAPDTERSNRPVFYRVIPLEIIGRYEME